MHVTSYIVNRVLMRLLVLLFFFAPQSKAAPSAHEFLAALSEKRSALGNLEGAARLKAHQKAFFQLCIDFPVLGDWILQDGGATAWEIALPEKQDHLIQQLFQAHSTDTATAEDSSLAAYVALCDQRRTARLSSALKEWAPFVFSEGETIRPSFIGYTEGLSDARKERHFTPGGRLRALHFRGGGTYGSPETIIDDPRGMIRDVDLSFDRQKLLFAWKKSDRLDDYHIYEHDLKQATTRQLTFGLGRADYEPIYLPDGDIVFASTRPEQSVPCWWTEISNLYRMDGEGRYVRRLAIDQVHTLYPQLMSNGRVCYTRWDYSDRGQLYPHPVFAMDPDGQAQRVFYGGNSWFPTSLLHMRPIPGSHKTMAVVSGHHTQQNGKLAVIDVNEGRDEGAGLQLIAPKRAHGHDPALGKASEAVADRWGQKGDQFRYPFPLSEEEFLVSYQPDFGFDPTWHYQGLKGFRASNYYGLYWMNADGEREFLWRDAKLGVQRMVSLSRKAEVEHIPDTVDYSKDHGTYYVHDVYRGVGLENIPRGEAKTLRVVEIDYRAAGVGKKRSAGPGGGSINSSPVSVGNATWDVKRILGDAEIHEDGSVLVDVPAMVSQYHQILNAKGQVIQTTRTWDTLRPGEQKSCTGCHDKPGANFYPFQKEDTLAWKHGVQQLKPFYGETRGFSFVKEIQPILDRHCVQCHDGSDEVLMDLRGIALDGKNPNKRKWTRSYLNLTDASLDKDNGYLARNPETGLVSWISMMSRPTELPPYFAGSAKSPLVGMLEEGHHEIELSEEELHKIYAWIDLLVPFSGDYREGHAWSETEMKFYDYYENKRKAQYQEELQNIQDFLAGIQDHPTNRLTNAAFTRAAYRAVLTGLNLQPENDGRYRFDAHPACLIDSLRLQADTDQKVSIQLRSKETQKVLSRIDLTAGEEGRMTFRKPVSIHDCYLDCSEPVTIRINEALGVMLHELPGSEEYRRHLTLTVTK